MLCCSIFALSFQLVSPGEGIKKAFVHKENLTSPGTKALHFCGTTQIDAKAPTLQRANTRLSLVTGEKPVAAYWGCTPFSPPSTVHSAGLSLLHSHHRQLSGRDSFCVLVCIIGFTFSGCVQYTHALCKCQPILFRVLPVL